MKTLSHSDLADLVEAQLQVWPMAKSNYDALANVKAKQLAVGDLPVVVYFNPARMVSTGAKLDKDTLSKRPCFLCKDNRPKEQLAAEIIPGWELLVNPYPIFPINFTIVATEHIPQTTIPLEMITLAEMMPDMVVFYNGAKAGASAPDHYHMQAVLKSELPLLRIAEEYHKPEAGLVVTASSFGKKLPFDFYSGIITPDKEGMAAAKLFTRLAGIDKITGKPDHDLVNAFCWLDSHGLMRFIVVPRTTIRPDCYGARPDDFTISPGAVDMAGCIITPRANDFERVDAERISEIYKDVAIDGC